MNPAFVYLAQNTPADAQWGRDSRTMLERSLDHLYRHYNDRFRQAVVIFHEGDFDDQTQREVAKGRAEIRFHRIEFRIPDYLDASAVPAQWVSSAGPKYGVWNLGHRHMCRFYALDLFELARDLGHDWVCRFDDDSVLHSPVDYDLFGFMQERGYDYGYRVDSQEPARLSEGFGAAVDDYVRTHGVTPTFWASHRWPDSAANRWRNRLLRLASWRFPLLENYVREPGAYDRWGYFNNFFVSRVDFWLSPPVRSFLEHFDRIGGIYLRRWNDLLLQSAAVQVFLPEAKLHKFTDWTYEHATVREGRLAYGGIWQGTADPDSPAVRAFVARYGRAIFDSGKTF